VLLVALCGALGACTLLAGCKRPSAQGPLAPEMRGPVKDLAAIRVGDEVSLTWTVPKKGTGKLAVNGEVKVLVCRRETTGGACTDAGAPLMLAPGAAGTFSEVLPAEFAQGNPRVLYYSVELMNRNGRPTGLSNSVPTMAGAPPPPIQGLTAQLTDKGVLLRWQPFATGDDGNGAAHESTIVRLHRFEMVGRQSAEAVREGFTLPVAATVGIVLDVEDGARSGQALDTEIEKGKSYLYRAQRVVQIRVGDQTLEMAGLNSNPAEVSAAGEAGR
jgi:hypothetical protein